MFYIHSSLCVYLCMRVVFLCRARIHSIQHTKKEVWYICIQITEAVLYTIDISYCNNNNNNNTLNGERKIKMEIKWKLNGKNHEDQQSNGEQNATQLKPLFVLFSSWNPVDSVVMAFNARLLFFYFINSYFGFFLRCLHISGFLPFHHLWVVTFAREDARDFDCCSLPLRFFSIFSSLLMNWPLYSILTTWENNY